MNPTKLIDRIFEPRRKQIEKYSEHAEEIQEKVLNRLVTSASCTEWGKRYNYKNIKDYSGFNKLPIQTYEDVKEYIDRMRHGEKDILWPGQVKWYAKSSGTTNVFLSQKTDLKTSITKEAKMPLPYISVRILTAISSKVRD